MPRLPLPGAVELRQQEAPTSRDLHRDVYCNLAGKTTQALSVLP